MKIRTILIPAAIAGASIMAHAGNTGMTGIGERTLDRMSRADCIFFGGDYPAASLAYGEIDPARLSVPERADYYYRYALSLIHSGLYDEARVQLRHLSGYKSYRNAYTFYTAYLDYIAGDFKSAYAGFKRVPTGIEGLDATYYMTQIEYSRGEYDRVISQGRSLLATKRVPMFDGELNRIVGLSYFKKGDVTAARQYLSRYIASTENPASDALYAMGVSDYERGDYSKATEIFERLTEDPTDLITQSAWLYLGQCRLQQGDTQGAAIAFRRATEMDLNHDVSKRAGYNYITSVTRGGTVPFASSASLLEDFVRTYPDSEHAAEVEQYLATAYYNEHNYEKALQSINAIRRPDADALAVKQRILYALGVERLSTGNASGAETALRQATNTGTDRKIAAEASLWLGGALYEQGKYREAARAYETALKSGQLANAGQARYNLAYAYFKSKDYAAAAREFKRVSESRDLPATLIADARLRRADCLYYTGQYTEAASIYGSIYDEAGTEADYALYRRSVILGLTSNPDKKIDGLLTLERKYPDSPWLAKGLLELAMTYEAQGRSSQAADAYARRLKHIDEVDIDELVRMSETMHSAGRWKDLLSVAERIRSKGGLSAEDLEELSLREADALAGIGQDKRADEIYSALAANPSSLAGAKAAVTQAERALRRKDYAKAETLMLDFTDAGTPHQYWLARGFIALADAYTGLGKAHLAKEYLNALRENYPGSEADILERIR